MPLAPHLPVEALGVTNHKHHVSARWGRFAVIVADGDERPLVPVGRAAEFFFQGAWVCRQLMLHQAIRLTGALCNINGVKAHRRVRKTGWLKRAAIIIVWAPVGGEIALKMEGLRPCFFFTVLRIFNIGT